MSSCDVFNCLFGLNVQNEIQLLSRVFCYSWLVCLLGFWLRNTSLVKVGNPISDRFRFSPCLMRKRVEKSEAILALLDSFQCISDFFGASSSLKKANTGKLAENINKDFQRHFNTRLRE